MKKSDREIMEILEAYDATGCAHSAAALAKVDPKTVRHYVAKREAGVPADEPVKRPKLIDPFVAKIEEAVDTGRCCQSVISSITLSVIRLIVSLLTLAP